MSNINVLYLANSGTCYSNKILFIIAFHNQNNNTVLKTKLNFHFQETIGKCVIFLSESHEMKDLPHQHDLPPSPPQSITCLQIRIMVGFYNVWMDLRFKD